MASASKSGASRRKAAPGKLRIVMKGLISKPKSDAGSDEEDNDLIPEDMEEEASGENGIPDDLPEGTVVVQPEAVEDEPPKKKREAPVRIDTSVLDSVSCTACGRQLNPYKNSALQKHPQLKVVICRRCSKFLCSGEIAKDKDGVDEQCRWCGEGGRLVVCDHCSSAFCKACVMRNFNRSEFNNINGQSKWKCYICDKAPLQGLRENYRKIRDTLKALQAKEKAKAAGSANKETSPTSNGTKASKSTALSASTSSMSSSSAQQRNPQSSSMSLSQKGPTSSNVDKDGAGAKKMNSNEEQLTIHPSDLKVEPDSVDILMDKLSTATDTFKGTLRALRAQFHPVSPGDEEDGGQQLRFTLSSRMNILEKKQRCAKALNSTLQTYVKSLKVILSGSSSVKTTSTSVNGGEKVAASSSAVSGKESSAKTGVPSSANGGKKSTSTTPMLQSTTMTSKSGEKSMSSTSSSQLATMSLNVGERARPTSSYTQSITKSSKGGEKSVTTTSSSQSSASQSPSKTSCVRNSRFERQLSSASSHSDVSSEKESQPVSSEPARTTSTSKRGVRNNDESDSASFEKSKKKADPADTGKSSKKAASSSSEKSHTEMDSVNSDKLSEEAGLSNSKKSSTKEGLSNSEKSSTKEAVSDSEKSDKRKGLSSKRVSKRSKKANEEQTSDDEDEEMDHDASFVDDPSSGGEQETGSRAVKETEHNEKDKSKKGEYSSQSEVVQSSKKSEKEGKDIQSPSTAADSEAENQSENESPKTSSKDKGKEPVSTTRDNSSEEDGNEGESESLVNDSDGHGAGMNSSDWNEKDLQAQREKKSSANEDENMAAKFDLIKELAEEMLKDNDEEDKEEDEGGNLSSASSADNIDAADDDEEEGGVVSKPSKKRRKQDIISSDEDAQPQKVAKTSGKGSQDQESPDKDQKKPEAKSDSEVSDASSSDILMSSDDDEDVGRRRQRHSQGSNRSTRKDKAAKEKPVVPKAKPAPPKETKTNATAKKGKDSKPVASKKSDTAAAEKKESAAAEKKESAAAEKKESAAAEKKESAAAKKGSETAATKDSAKANSNKAKVNGKKDSGSGNDDDDDDDDDDLDKEINKLSKMPVMRKRKAAKESEEDAEDEEATKKDEEPSEKPKATKTKRSKPGPKCSKKPEDFEDLSSDENDKKVESDNDEEDDEDDEEDDDDDDDGPRVTFCVDNLEGEKELNENELAKNGLLEEIDNDKNSSDDDDDNSDKSSSEDDSDSPKTKKKAGKGKKAASKKKKENEEDEDEEGEEDSDEGIGKKRKAIKSKLLDIKLSDSDSDVDTSNKKTKKKKEDEEDFNDDKEDKSSSGSSIESDLDEEDDEDKDDSENLSDEDNGGSKKKKKKQKKKGRKKKGKKKGKKGAKEGDDEEKKDEEEEDEDDESGGKKKGKGKKRRRIKKIANSSDEDGEKDSDDDDDDDDEDGKKNTPGHRRKIRKVMSNKKLEDSTRAAAKAEEKRRKRISAKQREFNIETITDENNPMNCPITTKLILEPGKEEGDEPLIQVNKKLVRKLKPHQVEAVQFMWDCMYESVKRSKKEQGAGCILAHCMGLGKTLSVISFVHTILTHQKPLGHRTALVVCPLNTVLNWQSEWTQWLDEEDQLEVWELASCKQNPARADMLKEWRDVGGIMILGYEMYRNLTTGARIKNKRQKKVFQETLVDPGPDLVICDEGHILKNEASAISKAMNLMKTRRRVVLTGTPLQNNLNEYHCMVSFVKPNLLGTRKEFNNRFISPIQNGQCTDSTLRDVKLMKARAHVLHEMLAGCVQRRDYSALTKFLPPKQEYVMSVRLTDIQIDLYNRYLELSGQGVDGVFNNKGARLFKDYQNLMKIWTHPWVLKMAEIRDELKMKYDDEDSFIDDESMDDRSFSSSDSSSDNEKFNSDSGQEGTSSGQRKGTRRTRAKARRQAGEDSDPEEVIAEWKSKTRGQNDEKPIELEVADKTITNDWWAEFVKEDDKAKMELSNKLFLLFEILRMCEEIGDKVLIFSQSILSLNIIENFLETVDSKFQQEAENDENIKEEETFGKSWTKNLDYYRMDGTTSAQNRQAWARSFNDLDNYRARLFLISTKAGGLGINLVAANRVIIFDASWNPSHDVQSIFRVYRFGQTKPCYIYRFLAQGTMEEKIYERQVTKLSLSQRVVDEHQIERHFSASDLKELYTFRPDRWGDGTDKPTLALPKDPLLAEILTTNKHTVQSFHEHDSLLENQIEQTLTEEEKKAAWEEYENEKKGIIIRGPGMERTNASWPMMAAAQILSREQITATVQALRQQLPDVSEDLFQLHVQQALRRMVQLKQEEMRRIEMLRMQEMNYINMMKQEAQGLSHAQSMAALQGMQGNMAPWLQIQRLRAMQAQMLQGMGAGSSGMMNPAMMGMAGNMQHTHRISNKPEEAIDLDASPTK